MASFPQRQKFDRREVTDLQLALESKDLKRLEEEPWQPVAEQLLPRQLSEVMIFDIMHLKTLAS